VNYIFNMVLLAYFQIKSLVGLLIYTHARF